MPAPAAVYRRLEGNQSSVGLNRTGRLVGSGGGVPKHATCATQDIGSWWLLKFRPLGGFVKGYFLAELERIEVIRLSDYWTEYRFSPV